MKKTLLMLGDSLVEWGDWDSLLPDIRVINRGQAGETTEELSARLFLELEQAPEADCILIMSGTNNFLMGGLHFPAILQTMLPRLVALCPGSTILLNSLFPMRLAGLPPEDLASVNRELKKLAEDNRCRFVDMTAPVAEHCLPITQPCFLNDGVHLSTRGYQVWAKEIQKLYSE
jgi:lysophospholipase L1-like esterase